MEYVVRHVCILLLCLGVCGCGVGYKYGYTTHHFTQTTDPGILEHNKRLRAQTGYHEVRLVDTTGLLMSGLVNTSRQYQARQDALAKAARTPDTNGDGKVEVESSYKPYGIYPGALTTVDFRIGTGPEYFVEDSTTAAPGTYSYWGADVVAEFWYADIEALPFPARATMLTAARFENYDYDSEDSPAGFNFNALGVDVTLGGTLSAEIYGLVLLGTLDIGLVTPVFKLILPAEGTNFLNGTATLEALYYPLPWLALSANVMAGRTIAQDRGVDFQRAGIGVALEFGSER